MGIACLSSLRSKDPSTKVGACIVDASHKVVSIGYNGMPRGIPEEYLSFLPVSIVFHVLSLRLPADVFCRITVLSI